MVLVTEILLFTDLQLTRPDDTAVTLLEFEQVAAMLRNDYHNPQFVVGLLVKLSRKFAEPNIFTKVKALWTLHRLLVASPSKVQVALSKATTSLQQEIDDKIKQQFFAVESVDDAGATAQTVSELKTVQLARVYASYVFNVIHLRNKLGVGGKSKRLSRSSVSVVDQWVVPLLLDVIESGEQVESKAVALAGNERDMSPLVTQVVEVVRSDRSDAVAKLRKYHMVGRCCIGLIMLSADLVVGSSVEHREE